MKNLKWTLIILLFYIAVFFNLERLDLKVENAIDIDSFVYGIGLIIVILTIIFPKFLRLNKAIGIFSIFVVYLFCKIVLFNHKPIFGGIYTYIFITELTLLAILYFLVSNVAVALNEFEKAVEVISLPDSSNRIQSIEQARVKAQEEMIRSRRFSRPLSLIIVEPESDFSKIAINNILLQTQRSMMKRFAFIKLGELISSLLRRTDMIIEQIEKNRFVLLCPETSDLQLNILVDRIKKLTAERLSLPVKSGFSTFPNNSLTLEELLKEAETELKSTKNLDIKISQLPN